MLNSFIVGLCCFVSIFLQKIERKIEWKKWVTQNLLKAKALEFEPKPVDCRALPPARPAPLYGSFTWSGTQISDSMSHSDLSYTENKLFIGHKFLELAIIN